MITPAHPQDCAEFELFDLRVEVIGPPDQKIFCGARLGDYFELQGEMLRLPPGQGFSIYSLAALLPLLAAKQRVTDPNCPTRFRITRLGKRRFSHSQVTATPLDPGVTP